MKINLITYNSLIKTNPKNPSFPWKTFSSKGPYSQYKNKLAFGIEELKSNFKENQINDDSTKKHILSNGEFFFEITSEKDIKELLLNKNTINCLKMTLDSGILTTTKGTLTLPENQPIEDFVNLEFTPSQTK